MFSSETGTKRNVVYDLVQSLVRSEKLVVMNEKSGSDGGGEAEERDASELAKSFEIIYKEKKGRVGESYTRDMFAEKLKEAIGMFEEV